MPEKFPTPHQETLSHYKQIGHREVLKEWRAIVPAEARKEWIRSFAEEKGGEALKEESGLYRQIIEKYLPEEERRHFDYLRSRLSKAKKHERYEDESMDIEYDLEYFMEENINNEMLNEFVMVYVSTFEQDEDKVRVFFQAQEKLTEQVKSILTSFFADGKKTVELSKHLSILSEGPEGSVYDLKKFGEFAENSLPQDFNAYQSALVIYGSGAIGPRKKGQALYRKKQDTDFLVIPKISRNADQRATEYALTSIVYMNSIMQGIIHNILPAGPKTLAKMESIFPELIQISKNFRKTGQRVEMHGVTFPDPVTGTIEDWRRLCGPHRIVSTPGDGWQEDYKLFLDAAVRSALAKSKDRKTTGKCFKF